MKKLEKFFILFALYVYTNFIVEDWSCYSKFAKVWYKPAWFVRATLIWLVSPVLIPGYLFKESELNRQIQLVVKDPKFQAELQKSMNMFKF